MPYGTDSFTDRYGDYKQPSVVDYDKQSGSNSVTVQSQESVEESLKKHQEDLDAILKEILSINPSFAKDRYAPFVIAKNDRLAWNIAKIEELKSDSDWLFNFRKYLVKVKKNFILNKKL